MRKWMKRPWFITVMFSLLSSGILITLIGVNKANYGGVFDLRWPIYLCIWSIAIVGLSYRRLEEKARAKRAIRYAAFVMPLLAVALFLIYKPAYAVQHAADIIESSETFEAASLNPEYHLTGFKPRPNPFIAAGYVFEARQEGNAVTVIFNPADAQYWVSDK